MTDWVLIIREPDKDPQEVPVAPGITVGRGEDNTVVLADPRVGTHHLRLLEESGELFVEDLGSANKTRVDGGETMGEGDRCALEPGMVLRAGHTTIECVSPSTQGTIRTGGPFAQAGAKSGGLPKGSFRATLTPLQPDRSAAPQKEDTDAKDRGTKEEPKGKPPAAPAPKLEPAPVSGETVNLSTQGQEDLQHEDALNRLRPRLVLVGLGMRRIAQINRAHFTIGRSEDSNLALPTQTISTEHAAIHFDGSGFFVQDKGSTNGTWVGESRVAKGETVKLPEDTKLKLGSLEALFLVENPTDVKQRRALHNRAAALLVKQSTITSGQRREALRLAKEDGRHVGETLLLQTPTVISDWLDAVEKSQKSGGWRLFSF